MKVGWWPCICIHISWWHSLKEYEVHLYEIKVDISFIYAKIWYPKFGECIYVKMHGNILIGFKILDLFHSYILNTLA